MWYICIVPEYPHFRGLGIKGGSLKSLCNYRITKIQSTSTNVLSKVNLCVDMDNLEVKKWQSNKQEVALKKMVYSHVNNVSTKMFVDNA